MPGNGLSNAQRRSLGRVYETMESVPFEGESVGEVDRLHDSDADDFVWEEYDTNKIFRSQRPSHVAPTSSTGVFDRRLSPSEFRSAVSDLLFKYLEDGDLSEATRRLEALDYFTLHDEFVFRSLSLALDECREESSRQLSSLLTVLVDSHTITKHQMSVGFERAVDCVRDFGENANDRLGLLIDFSVQDGVLGKAFVLRLPETYLSSLSASLVADVPLFQEALTELREYKKEVMHAVRDVLDGGSLEETIGLLEALGGKEKELQYEFVRRLIQGSFERSDRIREIVSVRLSQLSGNVLSADDIFFGFLRTLLSIGDSKLDAPKADSILCSFLLRAIVDEVLPPAFVSESLRMRLGGKVGRNLVRTAQRHLQRSGLCLATRFRKVWFGNDPTSSEHAQFKEAQKSIINSLFTLRDVDAAFTRACNLEMSPKQASDFVRKVLIGSMSRDSDAHKIAVELLHRLSIRELSEEDFQLALDDAWDVIQDTQLDVPDAPRQLLILEDLLREKHVLPKRFAIRSEEYKKRTKS